MSRALLEQLTTAATARPAGIAAPADRPSQRRCAPEVGSGPRVSVRMRDMSLRAAGAGDGGPLAFEGFASVTGQAYEMWDLFGPYDEIVAPGAFAQTLANPDLDVPLVLQHMDLRRIARTTNGSLLLDEITTGDPTGLHVLAPQLDPQDEDVAYIAPKLRSGLVDEMSFKFQIVAGRWSPDWTTYTITQVDIHRGDVAIVGYGANPLTAGSGLRADDPLDLVRRLDETQARAALDALRSRLGPAPARRRGIDLIPEPLIPLEPVR